MRTSATQHRRCSLLARRCRPLAGLAQLRRCTTIGSPTSEEFPRCTVLMSGHIPPAGRAACLTHLIAAAIWSNHDVHMTLAPSLPGPYSLHYLHTHARYPVAHIQVVMQHGSGPPHAPIPCHMAHIQDLAFVLQACRQPHAHCLSRPWRRHQPLPGCCRSPPRGRRGIGAGAPGTSAPRSGPVAALQPPPLHAGWLAGRPGSCKMLLCRAAAHAAAQHVRWPRGGWCGATISVRPDSNCIAHLHATMQQPLHATMQQPRT